MKNNIMVKNNWDDDRLQVVMMIYGNIQIMAGIGMEK